MGFEGVPAASESCSGSNPLRELGADREKPAQLRSKQATVTGFRAVDSEQVEIPEAIFQSFLKAKEFSPTEYLLGADTISIARSANRRVEMVAHQLAPRPMLLLRPHSQQLEESTTAAGIGHQSETTAAPARAVSPARRQSRTSEIWQNTAVYRPKYSGMTHKLHVLASNKQYSEVISGDLPLDAPKFFLPLNISFQSLPHILDEIEQQLKSSQLTAKRRSDIAKSIYNILERSDIPKETYPKLIAYLRKLNTSEPFENEGRKFIAYAFCNILSIPRTEIVPSLQIQILEDAHDLQQHPEFTDEIRRNIQNDFVVALGRTAYNIDIPQMRLKGFNDTLRSVRQMRTHNFKKIIEAMKCIAANTKIDLFQNDLINDAHELRIHPEVTSQEHGMLLSVLNHLASHSANSEDTAHLTVLTDDLLAMEAVALSRPEHLTQWVHSLTLVGNAPGTQPTEAARIAQKLWKIHRHSGLERWQKNTVIHRMAMPQPSRVLQEFMNHLRSMSKVQSVPLKQIVHALSLIAEQPSISDIESDLARDLQALAVHSSLSEAEHKKVLLAFSYLATRNTQARDITTLESVFEHLLDMESVAMSDPPLQQQWIKSLVQIANHSLCSREVQNRTAKTLLTHDEAFQRISDNPESAFVY